MTVLTRSRTRAGAAIANPATPAGVANPATPARIANPATPARIANPATPAGIANPATPAPSQWGAETAKRRRLRGKGPHSWPEQDGSSIAPQTPSLNRPTLLEQIAARVAATSSAPAAPAAASSGAAAAPKLSQTRQQGLADVLARVCTPARNTARRCSSLPPGAQGLALPPVSPRSLLHKLIEDSRGVVAKQQPGAPGAVLPGEQGQNPACGAAGYAPWVQLLGGPRALVAVAGEADPGLCLARTTAGSQCGGKRLPKDDFCRYHGGKRLADGRADGGPFEDGWVDDPLARGGEAKAPPSAC